MEKNISYHNVLLIPNQFWMVRKNSLKAALNLLKQLYTMSGLNINVDKAKALWIGSSCGSLETQCEEFALDWSQNPLKNLRSHIFSSCL